MYGHKIHSLEALIVFVTCSKVEHRAICRRRGGEAHLPTSKKLCDCRALNVLRYFAQFVKYNRRETNFPNSQPQLQQYNQISQKMLSLDCPCGIYLHYIYTHFISDTEISLKLLILRSSTSPPCCISYPLGCPYFSLER